MIMAPPADDSSWRMMFYDAGDWTLSNSYVFNLQSAPAEQPLDPIGNPVSKLTLDFGYTDSRQYPSTLFLTHEPMTVPREPRIRTLQIPVATTGQPHRMAALFLDASGTQYEIPMDSRLDVSGWTWLSARIPAGLRLISMQEHAEIRECYVDCVQDREAARGADAADLDVIERTWDFTPSQRDENSLRFRGFVIELAPDHREGVQLVYLGGLRWTDYASTEGHSLRRRASSGGGRYGKRARGHVIRLSE